MTVNVVIQSLYAGVAHPSPDAMFVIFALIMYQIPKQSPREAGRHLLQASPSGFAKGCHDVRIALQEGHHFNCG